MQQFSIHVETQGYGTQLLDEIGSWFFGDGFGVCIGRKNFFHLSLDPWFHGFAVIKTSRFLLVSVCVCITTLTTVI